MTVDYTYTVVAIKEIDYMLIDCNKALIVCCVEYRAAQYSEVQYSTVKGSTIAVGVLRGATKHPIKLVGSTWYSGRECML
jgi:hypothetical protein